MPMPMTKNTLAGADAIVVTPKGNIRIDRVHTTSQGRVLEKKRYYPGTFKNHSLVADFVYGSHSNKALGIAKKLKPGHHL